MIASEIVQSTDLGSATITPQDPVVAGSDVAWTITYTVGHYGIDDGGSLILAVRQMCDWGEPQFHDAAAPNYVRAMTTADAALRLSWSRKAFIRPWRQGLTMMVVDGHLAPGDTVTISLGDRSGGGPGLHAQTFAEPRFAMRLLVDCAGAGAYLPVGDDLHVPVVAGPVASLTLVGPSTATVGQPTWFLVRAMDRWGNVTPYTGGVTFDAGDGGADGVVLPAPYEFGAADGGVHRFEGVVFTRPGIWRVVARDESAGLRATANPCLVGETDAEQTPLYWGDPHGQSGETVGSGDVEDYWNYLHYSSGADFGAHCGNDFQITTAFYTRLRAIVQSHDEPGRFVPFLAYEWSANHPTGGDHNVYFLHDDPARSQIHRSSRWLIDDDDEPETDRHPLPRLREAFRGRDDVLILPHIGGRRANLDLHRLDDVAQSPLIEISSVHGRFFWFAREALERGLKVGFIAGSDDHLGRPGVAPPSIHDLVVPGGLTAVFAPELTREALWHGLRSRRCYGTSSPRIIVDVAADGHPMGSEYTTTTPPRFTGRIAGTAPIDSIHLRRGLDIVWTYDALTASPPDWSRSPARARLRVAWTGANSKNRPKISNWDGSLTISGGTILRATRYNLSHPAEGLTRTSNQAVAWRSQTSGEEDGVVLDLELTPSARLAFETPTRSFTRALADVGDDPLVIESGGVDQQVELRWVRETAGPLDVTWDWTDPEPPPGEHAYWVWATQADGACAWSSPIFVSYAPEG